MEKLIGKVGIPDFAIGKCNQAIQVISWWDKEVPNIHPSIVDQPQASNKKAILDGPASTLGSIEMELLHFLFAKCEQGINVRNTLVVCKASALLCDTFGPKSFNAKLKAVTRFMQRHNYVYRRVTHQVTRAITEVSKEAKAFLKEIRLLLIGPH